jgi:phosphoribosyl-ATP pyrophosphohydrolase/phosphoribosyl-AMP cyclohydrolase
MLNLDTLDFSKGNGFVTIVCQDARSRAVLMVARADREALERTMSTGQMHYHSRTRGLWHKGGVSGHVQRVSSMFADCDGDAVLALVEPAGPACHTGAASCFDVAGGPPETESVSIRAEGAHPSIARLIESAPADVLDRIAAIIAARALPQSSTAKASYTQRLLADRNLRLKKLGEEAAELAVACADGDAARAVEEGADLLFHTLVALSAVGVTLDDVRRVLKDREG